MALPAQVPSLRRDELLELAYGYVADHGLSRTSLRPLAAAVGSSPRVLLYLFGSKDGLIRALLSRARADELVVLENLPAAGATDCETAARELWRWLSTPQHRRLLTLWAESYARSLTEPDGPWAGFARATVDDWLALLASMQPARERRTARGKARRTLVLAVLRGALLDLLATGDLRRTSAAVDEQLRLLAG